MTFQPESFVFDNEIAPPDDLLNNLRGFARKIRKSRKPVADYPQRPEVLALLSEARASIERINAKTA